MVRGTGVHGAGVSVGWRGIGGRAFGWHLRPGAHGYEVGCARAADRGLGSRARCMRVEGWVSKGRD